MISGYKIQQLKKWVLSRFFSLRDNLFKITEIFPLISLIGTIVIYTQWLLIKIYKHKYDIALTDSQLETQAYIQLILKHYFDSSLLCILFMFAVSKNYSKFAWLCLGTVFALWLVNTVYIVFEMDTGLYYGLYSLIIYTIFVVRSIMLVTKR